MSVGQTSDYEKFFYTKEQDLGGGVLSLKDLGISGLPFKREFHDHVLQISSIGDPGDNEFIEFETKTIKKFKAELEQGGMVLLHFQIQLGKDAKSDEETFSAGMIEEMYIKIFKRQGDLIE